MAIKGRKTWHGARDFAEFLEKKYPGKEFVKPAEYRLPPYDPRAESRNAPEVELPEVPLDTRRMPKARMPNLPSHLREDDIVGRLAARQAAKAMQEKKSKMPTFTPRKIREAPGGRGQGGMVYPTKPDEVDTTIHTFPGGDKESAIMEQVERPGYREKAYSQLFDELKGTIGESTIERLKATEAAEAERVSKEQELKELERETQAAKEFDERLKKKPEETVPGEAPFENQEENWNEDKPLTPTEESQQSNRTMKMLGRYKSTGALRDPEQLEKIISFISSNPRIAKSHMIELAREDAATAKMQDPEVVGPRPKPVVVDTSIRTAGRVADKPGEKEDRQAALDAIVKQEGLGEIMDDKAARKLVERRDVQEGVGRLAGPESAYLAAESSRFGRDLAPSRRVSDLGEEETRKPVVEQKLLSLPSVKEVARLKAANLGMKPSKLKALIKSFETVKGRKRAAPTYKSFREGAKEIKVPRPEIPVLNMPEKKSTQVVGLPRYGTTPQIGELAKPVLAEKVNRIQTEKLMEEKAKLEESIKREKAKQKGEATKAAKKAGSNG
jgi:hypothetical protein